MHQIGMLHILYLIFGKSIVFVKTWLFQQNLGLFSIMAAKKTNLGLKWYYLVKIW